MSFLVSVLLSLVSVLLSALGGVTAGLVMARLVRWNMTGGLLGGMTGAMALRFYLYPVSEGNPPGLLAALLIGVAFTGDPARIVKAFGACAMM